MTVKQAQQKRLTEWGRVGYAWNMRKALKARNGVRTTFRGTFVRSGTKRGYTGKTLTTLLFKDITDADGNVVSDHLWFNYTKGFEKLSPWQPGDIVEFDARVTCYTKGYAGYREDVCIERPLEYDYKLSRPSRIVKVSPCREDPRTMGSGE
jgi:hypothetical protein